MRQAVAVHANLRCELDGRPFCIRASDKQIVVEVPDLATGLRLTRLGSPRGLYRSLKNLKYILDSIAHQAILKVRGQTVAAVGDQIGSASWKVFGLPAMQIRLTAIMGLLLKRHDQNPVAR